MADGNRPLGKLAVIGKTLYGTTESGGAHNHGTIYSITTGGAFTLLHSFDHSDGATPDGGLLNVNGTLYGTAMWGGGRIPGDGDVFMLEP